MKRIAKSKSIKKPSSRPVDIPKLEIPSTELPPAPIQEKKYKLYVAYHETVRGDGENIYTFFDIKGVDFVKDLYFFPSEVIKTDHLFNLGDIAYVIVVRYTCGNTFIIDYGQWEIKSIEKDKKVAEEMVRRAESEFRTGYFSHFERAYIEEIRIASTNIVEPVEEDIRSMYERHINSK